jgi:hypothetical protein
MDKWNPKLNKYWSVNALEFRIGLATLRLKSTLILR